ncbi:hypothetical protein CHISP_0512 [Chitinispirillum alkaliphilum]|nr:hypothetical protein CHISP_0512 [Chitinispirillum alkaliphilum]
MIIKKIMLMVLISVGFLLFCNYPEMLSVSESEFNPGESEEFNTRVNDRYFVIVPGDTAILQGVYRCTVITNGYLDTVISGTTHFRSVTHPDTSVYFDGERFTLFPKQFLTKVKIDDVIEEHEFTNLLSVTDSGVYQLSYFNSDRDVKIDKIYQRVVPRYYDVGYYDTLATSDNKWNSFPLLPFIISEISPNIAFSGFTTPTKTIATELTPYRVNDQPYRNGVELKSYYHLHWEDQKGGEVTQISKSFSVRSNYFVGRGLTDQYINIVTQKLTSDNSLIITKEYLDFKRVTQARPYSNWD